jgi:enamine deaminase RidA (YjgF/YER057c/UK114 family)
MTTHAPTAPRDTGRIATLAAGPATMAPDFAPALVVGDMVYTSGQLPVKNGSLAGFGLVGDTVTVEHGAQLARLCTANAIAAISDVVDLSRVAQVVKLTGFVASASGFSEQPAVMNGASSLLLEVFGEAGRHTRSAIGVAALPRNAPVEVELIVKLTPS